MAQLVKPMFTPFPTRQSFAAPGRERREKLLQQKTFHRAHYGMGGYRRCCIKALTGSKKRLG